MWVNLIYIILSQKKRNTEDYKEFTKTVNNKPSIFGMATVVGTIMAPEDILTLIPEFVNMILYMAKGIFADVIEVKDLEVGEFILDYPGLKVTTRVL